MGLGLFKLGLGPDVWGCLTSICVMPSVLLVSECVKFMLRF